MITQEKQLRLEEIKENIAEFGCISDRDHEQWLISELQLAWKEIDQIKTCQKSKRKILESK